MHPLHKNPSPAPTPWVRDRFENAALLDRLRTVAMACRAKPRTDLFKACALLQVSKEACSQAYAEALMRCLAEALGQPARLFAPGTREATFDETWLMQLIRSTAQGDIASVRFLLASRVQAPQRRLVGFLIRGIADWMETDLKLE